MSGSRTSPRASWSGRRTTIARVACAACLALAGTAWPQDPEPPPLGPRESLDFLKSMVVESRLGIRFADELSGLRLFGETLSDGRTWMEFIEETLAAAAGGDPADPAAPDEWAVLDEAVMVLLAEAERMRAFAAEAPEEERARFVAARRRYLEGAARLLKAYGTVAGDLFTDALAGLGGALDDLPDWVLPGEIEIRSIAGSGRLNTETLEFDGRLSGEIALPKFDATLVVPNASFDSRGNIDLSAFGMARFPPESPHSVRVTIPRRRPLFFHLSDDGDFRVAGAATVELPDGNTFEAFFDVDDPEYAFGLAFTGSVTLELAREVVLVRPVIDFDPANPPGLEVLEGLAQFLGSLGKGVETFLGDSPDLPASEAFDVGAPPDFEAPETVVPLDVFDAWVVAVGNEHVRPALNGPISGTAGLLLEALAGLRTHLEGVRREVEPGLTQLQRLSRVVEMNGRIREMLEDGAARAALGEDGDAVFAEASALADEALRAAVDYLEAIPPDADFKTGLAAVRLTLRAGANAAALDLDDTGLDFAIVVGKLDQWTASLLARDGLNADGSIADPDRVAALTPVDLRTLAMATLEIDRARHALGTEPQPFAPATMRLLRLEFEKVRNAYVAAVASGDDEARVRFAAKLPEYGTLAAAGILEATDEERDFMLRAFADTWTALAEQDGGGTPRSIAIAGKRLQLAQEKADAERDAAVRRKEELFGSAGGQPDLADRLDFSLYEYSFWQRLGFGIRALREAGILDAVLEGRLKADLASIFDFYRQALETEFADATLVRQNLEDAYQALVTLIDLIALLEDFVPEEVELIGEFRQTWEALHLTWVPIAEARKAHWLMAAYTRELVEAAARYGDGVGAALEGAFAAAGSEAAAGLARVVDGLAAALEAVGTERFRFALPGDLEVRRLFGDLAFNRLTGDWQVGFGGLLAFPDINASFEIPSATLASDGDFSMSLLTRGPAPFGLEESLSLEVETAFSFSGNVLAPSIDAAMASGRLVQSLDDGPPNLYDVSLAYEFLDPGHRMRLETSFQDQRSLFTNEIVLFSGGFGFDLETDGTGAPRQGGVETSLSAGLLLRPEARSKPVDQLVPGDFLLSFEGMAAMEFSAAEQRVALSLNSGTLTLPPDIFSDETGNAPATVSLQGRLCVEVSFATGELAFCDEAGEPFRLAFRNLVARIPGFEGALLAIPEATLRLSGSDLPVLENLTAALTLPLPGLDATDPGMNRNVTVAVQAADWRLDGLPEAASVNLADPLRLVDFDGFDLDLVPGMEAEVGGCPPGLGFVRDLETGVTTVTVAGGLKASVDPALLWDAGADSVLAAEAMGCFEWEIGSLPSFSIGPLTFSGRARLGGPDGVGVVGLEEGGVAVITFDGVDHLFSLAPGSPFSIRLDGALDIAGFVRFGLVDTAFTWDGSSLLPEFDPGGAQTELGDAAIDVVEDVLPVYLTKARVEIVDRGRPLIPGAGQAGLLEPDNVKVIVSGRANLPAGAAAIEAGTPGITGQVEDLGVLLVRSGDGFVPDFDVDGLGLQITNLDIPPLGGITGGIYVGNLDALDADPPRPQDIYFAGTVGAKVEDVGAEVLLALKPTEFIGACFELNAGPAGIPLDGGAAGGILLTGGKGGLNFKNAFADPCDFAAYIADDGDLPAPGSPGRPGSPPDLSEIEYPPVPDPDEGFDCIQGPFPPRTINPLCEPHPDPATFPDRVVFKGTVLTEAQLNAIGITRAAVPGGVGEAIEWAVGLLGGQVAAVADGVLAAVPPAVPAEVRGQFEGIVGNLVASFDDTARLALRRGFEFALSQDPEAEFYDLLLAAGAAGIPCFDVTLKLEGTFSHAAVSTVLSGSGGVTVSSTGTAVLEGTINLVGIPVGKGTFAYSLTDSNGDLNPSFGGVAVAEIGPLEFGSMSMAMTCDGCYAAVVDGFAAFLAGNAETLGAGALEFLFAMMDRTVPAVDGLPRDRGTDITIHYDDLAGRRKIAYVAGLLNVFQLVVNGDPLPVEVTAGALAGFLEHFRAFVVAVFTEVNPAICFSGQVGPKLFGFPLTGGADSVLGAHFLYGRRLDPATMEEYQELTAALAFSPSYLLMYPVMAAYQCPVVPAIDTAEMGFSLRVPALTEETVELALTDPAAYIESQLTTLVEDAVLSFGYELSPLGLTLGNGQGRMILPRLEAHPERPGVTWQVPSGPGVPTRTELILAALSKGQMKNPFWRGQAGELDDLFTLPANTDPDTGFLATDADCDALTDEVAVRLVGEDPDLEALAGLDLARDFFPHGGLMFGGEVGFPNVIAQLPPEELLDLLSIPTTLEEAGAWLSNAQFVIENYLAATTCVGQLAGYLPAPNPVFPPETDWSTVSLDRFLEAIRDVDPEAVVDRSLPSSAFAFDQILFAGWLETPLLGMPVARASMAYDPDDKVFRAMAEVPADTWLHELVQGSVTCEFRSPRFLEGATAGSLPVGGTEDRFADLAAAVAGLDAADVLANGGALAEDTLEVIRDTLPRASLVSQAGGQLPADLGRYFDVEGSAGLEVFAYSPFFDPEFDPGDSSPYGQARRRGGMGLRGDFRLGYFPDDGPPIAIDIPSASFAITPDADVGIFPSLVGEFQVGAFQLPGLPGFTDGLLAFNSSPDNGGDFLAVSGHLEPLRFTLPPGGGGAELLALRGTGPGGALGGTFEIYRDDPGTGLRLELEPMTASIPMFGGGVVVAVDLAPIAIDRSSSQPWSGIVRISGTTGPASRPAFSLRDPLDPFGSAASLSFSPNAPVLGTIAGVGTQSFELQLEIPNGFEAVFFPGRETETRVQIGGTGTSRLLVDSTGRFYVDFGQRSNIGLPGVLTAGGRLEFGYNPVGSGPDVRVTLPAGGLAFADTDLNETRVRTVSVRNAGTAAAEVVVGASPPSDFSVDRTFLRLAPGVTRDVDVIFHPSATGSLAGTLHMETNDEVRPVLEYGMSGRGISRPIYYQSRNRIDLGLAALGDAARGSVSVGNVGSAPLVVTSVASSNPAIFRIASGGGFTLAPGEERLVVVEFVPSARETYDGAIRISAAAPVGAQTVALTGRGGDPQWITLVDAETAESQATLRDIRVLRSGTGWAVGDEGTVLETRNFGRSWTPRDLTAFGLRGIAVEREASAPIAEYHFEEPSTSLQYRDDGPNGYHGSAPSVGNRPLGGYDFGRFGSGLFFDNPPGSTDNATSDYVELETFDLPPSFAIALWVAPEDTRDNQFFVGKHDSGGGNQFLFGFWNGGYFVAFNPGWQWHSEGAKQAGWQHLVVNASYNASSDVTTVQVYRNGALLWTSPFNGNIAGFGGGRPWVLGHDWDGDDVSDLFHGSLDEVTFFGRSLGPSEISAMAGGEVGRRILLVGEGGTALQSETRGRSWHQILDQTANGWNQRLGTYTDYSWTDATFTLTTPADKILITGAKDDPPWTRRRPVLMLEDGYDPDPFFTGDEEYGEVAVNAGTVFGDGEILNGVATLATGRNYAASSSGRIFQDSGGTRFTWQPHGGLDLTEPLNAVQGLKYQPGIFEPVRHAYVAVGGGGAIVRSVDGAAPVRVNHGLTTSSLRAIAWNGHSSPIIEETPDLYVVGDDGRFLTSSDRGVNWDLRATGLRGNNHAIDVHAGTGSEGFRAWVAGEEHGIQYLPESEAIPARPFLTVFPGEIEFGQLLLGNSRTLPLRVHNRGGAPASITDVRVSGPGFSIAEGGIGTLSPRDAATLQVRYRPEAASDFDLGEIELVTGEGETLRIPLVGRVFGADWQPVMLSLNGVAIEGEVVALRSTPGSIRSQTNVYALVDSGDRSRVFRSLNSGVSWSAIDPVPPKGQVFRFASLDVIRNATTGADVVALAGGAYNLATGALLDGEVRVSFNSGGSWSPRSPNDGVILPFGSVRIFPDSGRTNVMVASSSDPSGNAEVWQTTNSGLSWFRKSQPPANRFVGGPVDLIPVLPTSPVEDGSVVAAASEGLVYARNFDGEWPYHEVSLGTDGKPALGFNPLQTVRDLRFGWATSPFFRLQYGWVVGDKGMFWRWRRTGDDLSPFEAGTRWLPAANQEVFGTTNLAAVAFEGDNPNGLVVGGSSIFRTDNHGESWSLDYDVGGGAVLKSLAARMETRGESAWAGGSADGKATVWRNRPTSAPARGILLVNDIEFLDDVELGGSHAKTLILRNVGSATLNLHNVRIESDDTIDRFRIVGSPPASIAAGGSVGVSVALDGLPDPVDVASLDPQTFFRFENGWGDTVFNDHSRFHRDAMAPSDTNRRPLIHQDREADERDRSLRFDGNDYATFEGPESFPGDFSVAFWIDPEELGRNQNFIGKHDDPATLNQLLIGWYGNQYHVRIRGATFGAGTPALGWQHLVVTGRRIGGSTVVTFWKDGEVLWQATLAAALGEVPGRPWVLGGDWDGNAMTDTLRGRLDDVAVFDRMISEAEIRMLANESPACGEHRARLVFNSGSEDGERVTELRGAVVETSDLVIVDTIPSGRSVTVDGIVRATPFGVAVRCTATNATEWVEGSLHTITAPAEVTVSDPSGHDRELALVGWNAPGDETIVVTARPGLGTLTASYAVAEVVTVGPPPSAVAGDDGTDPAVATAAVALEDLIGSAPRGPFVRLTGGNVAVGGLGGGGFSMNGELFANLSRVQGSLDTTAVRIPGDGSLLAVGEGSWLLDMQAGHHFTLKANPPSVSLLGFDLAPETALAIEMDAIAETWRAEFALEEEFKPVPGFLEFKRGLISIDAGLGGPSPVYAFRMKGGFRAFPVPAAFNDPDGWAINTTSDFVMNSTAFDSFAISLGTIDKNSGFFQVDGSAAVTRSAGGPLTLGVSLPTFHVNGYQVAQLAGSISTDGELVLAGDLPSNGLVHLGSGNRFNVRNTSGSDSAFSLRVRALPDPEFQLEVPALTFQSNVTGFPAGGLSLPGVTIDSTGAFDTGKLSLPSWTFDGIDISKPSGGARATNYIRLKRGSDGAVTFDTRAQLRFLPECPLHDFALTIGTSRVSGSFRGRFCVLPEPISLAYDSASSCQFSGSAFGWTIFFGDTCAGFRNDLTGICVGDCQ